MNCHALIAALLLVTTVSGASAQSLSKDPERPMARPLNLSVRPAAVLVVDPAAPLQDQEATVANPVQADAPGRREDTGAIVALPYGTGFESRQQSGATGASRGSGAGGGGSGSSGGGSGSGGGGGGGGGGSGGGGRGGAGRGR